MEELKADLESLICSIMHIKVQIDAINDLDKLTLLASEMEEVKKSLNYDKVTMKLVGELGVRIGEIDKILHDKLNRLIVDQEVKDAVAERMLTA